VEIQASLTHVIIPSSVTKIAPWTFCACYGLTNMTIPSGLTDIAMYAFYLSTNLTGVYCQGNSPSVDSTAFSGDNNATIYYLPGTMGWASTFGGRPTALWLLSNPVILNNSRDFGPKTNGFSFTISWATNLPVAVEACTDLAHPAWSPIRTNALINGWSYFSDPEWTNYPARFYRVRSP
jgi:BspA type Leucine rich repeat region (6 copies)